MIAGAVTTRLDLDAGSGTVRRVIGFTSALDRALGLDRYRLVSDLAGRDGYGIEHLVEHRPWYAPWRRVARWEPLILVDVQRWSALRFASLHEARTWLRFNITRGFPPHPTYPER